MNTPTQPCVKGKKEWAPVAHLECHRKQSLRTLSWGFFNEKKHKYRHKCHLSLSEHQIVHLISSMCVHIPVCVRVCRSRLEKHFSFTEKEQHWKLHLKCCMVTTHNQTHQHRNRSDGGHYNTGSTAARTAATQWYCELDVYKLKFTINNLKKI